MQPDDVKKTGSKTTAKSLNVALGVAKTAARAGASVVMEHYHAGVAAQTKIDSDQSYNLVTQADLDCEQAVAAAILSAYPDHVILGEEAHTGATDAEHLWIVDPIDGTNNFAHRIPLFAVSVAYYYQGRAQAAVVLNPVTEHCYAAAAGAGATLNESPIAVSDVTTIDKSVISTGFYYDRGPMMQSTLDTMAELFKRNVHGLRRFGAASLDLCMVAAGQCDAYFEYNLAPWDFAGGQLILAEAGGRATNCHGQPLPIGNSPILASNGHLHDALIEILAPFVARL